MPGDDTWETQNIVLNKPRSLTLYIIRDLIEIFSVNTIPIKYIEYAIIHS